MAISLECEGCRATFRAKIELAGKRLKCPKCGGTIQVPAGSQRVGNQGTPADVRPLSSANCATATSEPSPKATKAPKSQVPSSPGSAEASGSYEELTASVPASFEGQIERVRVAFSYRLAAMFVAVVMVLLPMIYVGLILLVCWAVWYHAVYHTAMFGIAGGIVVLLVYLAPLAIGTILVVFMIKPLFARRADDRRRRSLTRNGEPLLFAFVDQICQRVGAPPPRRIDVDCDVNASASFRRGLLSFWGNDLVLTIGLPLVAGLNLRQFSGVLAHEFGHFSQGAGMRLSFLIRSITFWFQRVVYERDQLDDWLSETSESVDLRIGWVLYVAQFFVWLTRKILFALMLIGHVVSGYLLRQMEFDADRYKARLAGSETFAETVRRLSLLQLAFQGARADLAGFYEEGKLVDNLPKLTRVNMEQVPAELTRQISQSIDESRTGMFDTHPCARDRIANAQRENAPGVFRLEQPSAVLFRDFEDASRKVTWDFYRAYFGPKLKPQELHPIDDLLRGQQEDNDDHASLVRFFHGQYQVSRPLEPRLQTFNASEVKDAVRIVQETRQAMFEQLEGYRTLARRREKYYAKGNQSRQVLQLADAGIEVSSRDFGASISIPEARKSLRQAEERISATGRQMAAWEGLAAQRLGIAIGLLFCEPIASQVQDVALHQQRCRRVLPACRSLQAAMPQFHELQMEYSKLVPLLPQLESEGEDEIFLRSLLKQMGIVCDGVSALREPLRKVPYPFDHAQRDMTIARFLLKEPLIDRQDLAEICSTSEIVLDRYATLTGRSMSVLTAAADAVEVALGLEPLPEPTNEGEPRTAEN